MGFIALLHLVLIKRPARPLTLLAKNVMAYFSDVDRLLNVALAILAIPVMAFLVYYLIYRPLSKAGSPDEPAPPTAMT